MCLFFRRLDWLRSISLHATSFENLFYILFNFDQIWYDLAIFLTFLEHGGHHGHSHGGIAHSNNKLVQLANTDDNENNSFMYSTEVCIDTCPFRMFGSSANIPMHGMRVYQSFPWMVPSFHKMCCLILSIFALNRWKNQRRKPTVMRTRTGIRIAPRKWTCAAHSCTCWATHWAVLLLWSAPWWFGSPNGSTASTWTRPCPSSWWFWS